MPASALSNLHWCFRIRRHRQARAGALGFASVLSKSCRHSRVCAKFQICVGASGFVSALLAPCQRSPTCVGALSKSCRRSRVCAKFQACIDVSEPRSTPSVCVGALRLVSAFSDLRRRAFKVLSPLSRLREVSSLHRRFRASVDALGLRRCSPTCIGVLRLASAFSDLHQRSHPHSTRPRSMSAFLCYPCRNSIARSLFKSIRGLREADSPASGEGGESIAPSGNDMYPVR